ncbi:Smr/MutS family protein [Nitrobacter sp. TKz-YC02]|uniref:Smr/MutS family protein n=1 Tax=Nitrobacter sp. TKz-YC02 TaxID=3398704 RepID=UPI003CFB745A
MKRRLSPDASARPSRQRVLTEEERHLWESVAGQAKPLRKRPRPDPSQPRLEVKSARIAWSESNSIKKTARFNSPQPVPLTRRERSQLSRGRKDIDARIDLHGMTQTRAYRALLQFLQNASGDGLTFVLVITGKGRARGLDSERGVLRRQVPQWLALPEFRSLVVGFDEAHSGHGGEGALYVRLRRRVRA